MCHKAIHELSADYREIASLLTVCGLKLIHDIDVAEVK